jgi:hypothetical protein
MATTTTIEDEIVLLESAYWESMKLNDTEGSLMMTHDPCIVTGAQGVMQVDHNGMREMSKQKTWKLKDYTIDNMNVIVVSDSVVVTGYTIKLSMEVEGKETSMNCSEGSTWVKKDGKWVCPLHCEAPMGDPFGRDKSAK